MVKKKNLYLGQSIYTLSNLKHTQQTGTYDLLVQFTTIRGMNPFKDCTTKDL